jgi:Uma2 family endonuclease
MKPAIDLPSQRMTVDQFIEWSMQQPRGRFELVDGEIIAMAAERAVHALTKHRVARALEDAVGRAGHDCTVFPDGMTVVIDQHTSYEPDCVVQCGAPLELDKVTVDEPLIVVEVASPSISRLDSTLKTADYFRVPTIAHCLILDGTRRILIHHQRGNEGTILTRILRDGTLRLDPPGIELAIADLFIAEPPQEIPPEA